MPGTVLRINGRKSAIASFLASTEWKPLTVYWKGTPRLRSSRQLSRLNGFNVEVSSASGLDLKRQTSDARRFLRKHTKEFRRLRRLRLSAVLDFGVSSSCESGPVYYKFPRDLITNLASNDVELEVSYYGEQPG
jgi:hypothetical protein